MGGARPAPPRLRLQGVSGVSNVLIGFGGGIVVMLVALLTWRIARGRRRRESQPALQIQHFTTSMRAVGELSVFRVMTKEVITASDHWLGEFGKKYLHWLFSSRRITLIIEFDVDFRYDLEDSAFAIERLDDDGVLFRLPPCRHEVLIRDLRVHSEDNTELLPWLMPELLNRFLAGGFSPEAKNRLIQETRLEAARFAGSLVQKAASEAQASARRTLTTLAQGLGARYVEFEFQAAAAAFSPTVDSSRLEAALPAAHGFLEE
jgi:hypothetical protein